MKSEAGRLLGFALGDRIIAAPGYAPYPSTLPLPPEPEPESAPWWSERMLLDSFRNMALFRLYTQPSGLVQ